MNPLIVFIGSCVSTEPGIGNPHYSSAKSALLCYAKHLSNLLAKDNIRVNTISPAAVYSESLIKNAIKFGEKTLSDKEKIKSFISNEKNKSPLNKIVDAKEIAEFIRYLSSNNSFSITGQNFIIDAGKNKHV